MSMSPEPRRLLADLNLPLKEPLQRCQRCSSEVNKQKSEVKDANPVDFCFTK